MSSYPTYFLASCLRFELLMQCLYFEVLADLKEALHPIWVEVLATRFYFELETIHYQNHYPQVDLKVEVEP